MQQPSEWGSKLQMSNVRKGPLIPVSLVLPRRSYPLGPQDQAVCPVHCQPCAPSLGFLSQYGGGSSGYFVETHYFLIQVEGAWMCSCAIRSGRVLFSL
jgi:hypothetical protein